MTAEVLITLCWILWGLLTPGDFFANGSSYLMPSLCIAAIIGFVLGWKFEKGAQKAIVIGFVASLCFWLFVPAGWWVKGLVIHGLLTPDS